MKQPREDEWEVARAAIGKSWRRVKEAEERLDFLIAQAVYLDWVYSLPEREGG